MKTSWEAIRLAVQQGYRANLETGEIFGKTGKRLQGVVKALAHRFGVTPSTISIIGKGKSWANVSRS